MQTPNFDAIDPSICINGKMKRLQRLVNNRYQEFLEPYGMKGSILSILFIIGKKPGINQKQISENLILDASTMSRDIKMLASKGYIEKERDNIDKRNTIFFLSTEGKAFLEEIVPHWQRAHDEMNTFLDKSSISTIDQVISTLKAAQQ
ncbi:DNA-binding transcriptional regulator, MarR family [Spirosomataceae bacterium TFI 002]|nr:DNA-binding transcriptional regulator, MarR family [Spirosomataceae bacterium TFI 002]